MLTCKTCGVKQIPDTWFGECKRCYDMAEPLICWCDLGEWCDIPEHNEEVVYFDQ